ncbi:MAG TPA: hypothetical protein VN903_02955 [Polyangia bacterium]|nr:hypothetical protein [Polyangia bacterium]
MTTLRRAVLLGCVTVLATSVARAQTQPPPVDPAAPPAAVPPPAAAPAPAAAEPPAAPPAGAPGAPVAPLSPTMAPEPAGAPPLVLTERTEPLKTEPRPEPFYDKPWFWGALGVVVATVAIILVWNISSNRKGPPDTTFGNMNAF